MFHVKLLGKISNLQLSQMFFWLFLISLPFNKRVIYQPEQAYIDGYFSYYLAIFLYFSDILIILCLAAWLIENRRGSLKRWFSAKNGFVWPILTLVLASLIGLFHVKQTDSLGFYSIIKLLELVFLAWYAGVSLNIQNWRIFAWIIYISAIFQAILGIWQFHVQQGLGLRVLGEYVAPLGTGGLAMLDTTAGKVIRAYGTFPHPNIFGAFLVFGLILGYFLIVSRETSQKQRILIAIGEYLLILGIFLSFSRISWAISGFASIFFLWYVSWSKKWLRLAILIPVIVSCATILLFWNNLLFNRVSNVQTSNSYTDRGILNRTGLEIAKKYPIFGTGLGEYIPQMRQMFHVQPWQYQPPHNVFIYILASTGIVGLIAFAWLLAKIFLELWQSKKSDLRFVLLVLGVSIIIVSMFDHFPVTIQQGQLMFALILGLMAGYPYYEDAA